MCFSSFGGEIDIVQDVPIYGPLNRKDVEDIAAAIDTRRFEEVPYWLDLDYQSASVLREATERLKFVSARVEVVVGREGAVHIAGEKTATASAGVELRGVPVAPRVEMDDDHDDENEEGGERRKRRRGTTTARTAQLRLAEMRAVASGIRIVVITILYKRSKIQTILTITTTTTTTTLLFPRWRREAF